MEEERRISTMLDRLNSVAFRHRKTYNVDKVSDTCFLVFRHNILKVKGTLQIEKRVDGLITFNSIDDIMDYLGNCVMFLKTFNG